jgi:hypothetical protein
MAAAVVCRIYVIASYFLGSRESRKASQLNPRAAEQVAAATTDHSLRTHNRLPGRTPTIRKAESRLPEKLTPGDDLATRARPHATKEATRLPGKWPPRRFAQAILAGRASTYLLTARSLRT